MAKFVVYHIESTVDCAYYERFLYALNYCNKLNNERVRQTGRYDLPPEYAVTDIEYYKKEVVKKVTVQNLMTGEDVVIDSNTPLSCDPSSETYWSM